MRLIAVGFAILIGLHSLPALADGDGFFEAWWPCPTASVSSLSSDLAWLAEAQEPIFEAWDKAHSWPQGTAHARADEIACKAEKNPEFAASEASLRHFSKDWTTPTAKRGAAEAAAAVLRADSPDTLQTQAKWYGYASNAKVCAAVGSPTVHFKMIQQKGGKATSAAYGDPAHPYKIEIADRTDSQTGIVWTYWADIKDCERANDPTLNFIPVNNDLSKKQWYSYNKSQSHCLASNSPADRIAEIQDEGKEATTKDYGDPAQPDKVDVIVDMDNGDKTYWTYWTSISACEAELPKNRPINSKYR